MSDTGRKPERVIGVPWYRPERYAELRALFADQDEFPPTWERWRRRAQYGIGMLERGGFQVYRVPVEPAEFLDWCASHDLTPDSRARVMYADAWVAGLLGYHVGGD